jgi:hypothetical protein
MPRRYPRLTLLICWLWTSAVGAQATPNQTNSISEAEKRLLEKALKTDAGPDHHAVHTKQSPSAVRHVGSSSTNPDIALILDFAAAYFSQEDGLQTGAHDPAQTGLTFQQLELHAESRVDPYFELQANLVFSALGVEVEDAYAQTLAMPWSLQVKAGQMLLPFGRVNPTHPHAWSFLNQALMVGKFMGSEGGRGLGIETSWLAPLPWFTELTVAISQPNGECCSKSFSGGPLAPTTGWDDFLYLARLEQFWELTSAWSVLLGGSYLVGENKSGLDNLSALAGGDLLIRYRPTDSAHRRSLSLQVEWTHRNRQRPEDVLIDHGGYVEAVARWSPEWSSGVRWEWVSGVENDDLDPEWTGGRMRTSAQVTWTPSHFSRLRLQVGHDDPEWLDTPIWSTMLGLEVLAGAHGAHDY